MIKTDRDVAVKLFQKLKKWRKNNKVDPGPLYESNNLKVIGGNFIIVKNTTLIS